MFLDYTEAYGALEKGTVEAVITAPAAGAIFGLPEVSPNLASCYMVAAVHGFSINLDAWNNLPGKIQDILQEEATKMSDEIDAWVVSEWYQEFDRLTAAGCEIYTVPQAEMDRWKAACQPYIDEQLAIYGDFGKKVMDIIDEANKKYPR